jgi:hypothetical protein
MQFLIGAATRAIAGGANPTQQMQTGKPDGGKLGKNFT